MSLVDDIKNRRDAAWRALRRHIETYMDEYCRHSIDGLTVKMFAGQLPEWQVTRLNAYWVWWEAVMAHYGAVKAQILAGQDVIYNPAVAGPCPWDIWQLVTE